MICHDHFFFLAPLVNVLSMNQLVIFEFKLHLGPGDLVDPGGHIVTFLPNADRKCCSVRSQIFPPGPSAIADGCVSSWTWIKTEVEFCHVYLSETLHIADHLQGKGPG